MANKVTFEIKDAGDVQGAKMEDEQAMGKVILRFMLFLQEVLIVSNWRV